MSHAADDSPTNEKPKRRRRIWPIGCLTTSAAVAVATVVGVWFTVERRTRSWVELDLQSLTAAMQSYKADHQQYPPDFSDRGYENRQTRFNNHRSIAWPRASMAYSTLKSYILVNTNKSYGYNYKDSSGKLMPLNLDTLDQAEAVVFWLGGFPTPYDPQTKQSIVDRKIFGFATDVTNPFRLDVGIGQNPNFRTTTLLDFDESRLVDSDGDGWWEYIPLANWPGTNGMMPPYVYFDAGGYGQLWPAKDTPGFTGYPMPRASDPNSIQVTQLMETWGIAVPYASDFPDGVPFPWWQNPTTFQIICAGRDGMYGNPASTDVRIPCFPSGKTYSIPGLAKEFFDQQELDNLTNFLAGTIDNMSAIQQGTGISP
jgi:hypothetical protein